ncbi:MAG: response regulator [Oligoflexales bacterium]|nr:response regulator [Oligoflexales bacterium]
MDVAIIEDDPMQNKMIAAVVKRVEGLNPIGFLNPIEALEAIEQQKIRIVITDILLPDMYGDDVIKKCMHFSWSIDFIVITGMEKMLVAYRCFNLGAREVFLKPIKAEKLKQALTLVVGRYESWNHTVKELIERKNKN